MNTMTESLQRGYQDHQKFVIFDGSQAYDSSGNHLLSEVATLLLPILSYEATPSARYAVEDTESDEVTGVMELRFDAMT